jgi:hypothetical protein
MIGFGEVPNLGSHPPTIPSKRTNRKRRVGVGYLRAQNPQTQVSFEERLRVNTQVRAAIFCESNQSVIRVVEINPSIN